MQSQAIKELIEQHLTNSQAIVEGEDGVHFTAIVISPEFRGKSRIEQQQMIYAVLGSYITSGKIHALSLKTYTPEEYQQG